MRHLWLWFVGAVWPNLVASLLWVAPAFTWHHLRVMARLDAIHGHVRAASSTRGGVPWRGAAASPTAD